MIGRRKELEILNNVCNEKESKLVVIHGRRRIGKTYLVNHMFKQHKEDCLFFKFTGSATQNPKIQMENFIFAIEEYLGESPEKKLTEWNQIFNFLKNSLYKKMNEKKKKIVLFIDEVAWIDRNNKVDFLSSFGHFYENYSGSNDNLMVILCGSNASWIKEKIMKDTTGPLYHRIDEEISMLPFDIKETKEYLIKEKNWNLDNKSIVDIYMILGGIAKYLNYLDSTLSISENINKLFFTIGSPLFNEYETIMTSLFYDKSNKYKDILTILSKNNKGYTIAELEKIISSDSRYKISSNIDNLEDTGFIKGINKFNNIKKEIKYILVDPLCLFHLKWIRGTSKSDIISNTDYFSNILSSNNYNKWTGFAFEAIWFLNIHLYLDKRGLKSAVKSIGYWDYKTKDKEDKGAQIDLVIEYNNVYDLVECKYYNKEFEINKNYSEILLNKKDKFIQYAIKRKKYDIKLCMLTTYGTKRNQYYNQLNISQDITLDDLLGE